jgi:selenophosphate synthetase-related protein
VLSTDLDAICRTVRSYPGLTRKQAVGDVFAALRDSHRFGDALPNYGDDAAVMPWQDGYLLLAADGMMTGLLVNEPYAAGKAAVMVTVNDIYAMGGRPIGLVNVLASGDAAQRATIVEGIAKGCAKLQVPMLGGHLHPDAPADLPALSVAILGHATQLLRSHLAVAGDALVIAVDLTGRPGCKSVGSWDANSGKTPEQLRARLEIMPRIAEAGLARAAKDISNAGLLGTAAIMMENSGTGAVIDVEAVPRPAAVPFEAWIKAFQSYGFILAVHRRNADAVVDRFTRRHITAAVVGEVTAAPTVVLRTGTDTRTLFDFGREAITGIVYSGSKLEQ